MKKFIKKYWPAITSGFVIGIGMTLATDFDLLDWQWWAITLPLTLVAILVLEYFFNRSG